MPTRMPNWANTRARLPQVLENLTDSVRRAHAITAMIAYDRRADADITGAARIAHATLEKRTTCYALAAPCTP